MNNTSANIVKFTRPLIGVTSSNAVVVVLPPDPAKEALQASVAELAQTAKAIDARLVEIMRLVKEQRQSVMDATLSHALVVAQSVLQNDEEMVTQRLNQQLETAITQMCKSNLEHGADDDTLHVFVHPDHVDQIESVVSGQEQVQRTIVADPSLAPGDSRVEMGQTGLLASLDAQIDHISAKLIAVKNGSEATE